MRLLLVEDDPVIGEATSLHLQRDDHEVTWLVDGLDAWREFESAAPAYDVVLSDVMLPGLDGVSLCRRIRAAGTTPVLLISARSDAVDVVGGLEAGADDYVTKPFDVQVLLARIRSAARRAQVPATATAPADDLERVGDLTLDRRTLTVHRDGRRLALTPTEMRLLLELVDAHGRVLSRRDLLERVWEYAEWEDADHLVTVHVQRLRAKIGRDRIETLRGFGYKLVR